MGLETAAVVAGIADPTDCIPRQMLGDASSSRRLESGLLPRLVIGNACQNNRLTVRKLRYNRQCSAHGLDRLSERGQQDIASFFEARNTVLSDHEAASSRSGIGATLRCERFLNDQALKSGPRQQFADMRT